MQMGECVSGGNGLVSSEGIVGSVIIDQAEIYSSVFAPISEAIDKREQNEKNESGKLTTHLMVGVVLEYIRSLSGAGITVLHFINELVINGLVKTGQFYQLHQLLQYHVLADSKPLVTCLLLSLVGVYSAAEQLSLDMLSRLNTAHDEITEVLLSHKLVIQALKYAKSIGQAESVSARKFLEVAMATDDPLIFFSTYKFFTQRNTSLRGNSEFVKGEHCDDYIKHFHKLFEQNSRNIFILR
ncbi:hypothetical protein Avbf_07545, partial [Armadillidium vulgare]